MGPVLAGGDETDLGANAAGLGRAGEEIERHEGHVAQYLGDGILVYFGYPRAHEDDAERAVRAGLEMLVALEEGTIEGAPERLEARVGIHTGPVVIGLVGAGEQRETLALGDTTNLAARLQGVAEPGAVVVSDATLRLVPEPGASLIRSAR